MVCLTNKDFENLNDREFDMLLEDIIEEPSASDMPQDINPWRKAMNRVLWGTGLTTLTLNFLKLDTILPAIGLVLLILGYRTLRNENGWFKAAYIISTVRAVWFCISTFFQSTVLMEESGVATFLAVGTYIWLIPAFISLLALRNGIRAVQRKAGLPAHGGTGLLIWYLIILLLAFINFEGFALWVLIIAYCFILRGLYKLSKELTEAGYTVSTSSVKVTDKAVAISFVSILLVVVAAGYLFFNHYPMQWTPTETTRTEQATDVAKDLIGLGFPETVLQDMTDEEILDCEGAAFVLVHKRDYDMERNRGIGTQEEIDGGKIALITPDQAEAHLRFTFIGVKFSDEREHWKLIHHFEWLTDTDFCGTEAIQMWPSDRSGGWSRSTDVTGRLLYEKNGTTHISDYHSLGEVSYQKTGILADMLGQYDNHDVFATFSLPSDGARQRGYVMYDILEMQDGYIVDSWFNYIHQKHQLQFPVKTAKEFEMTSSYGDGAAFQLIHAALQFTTPGEIPGLI